MFQDEVAYIKIFCTDSICIKNFRLKAIFVLDMFFCLYTDAKGCSFEWPYLHFSKAGVSGIFNVLHTNRQTITMVVAKTAIVQRFRKLLRFLKQGEISD